jgi:hypothetical protein
MELTIILIIILAIYSLLILQLVFGFDKVKLLLLMKKLQRQLLPSLFHLETKKKFTKAF